MGNPSVCCVMLTADRPALTARAVECFRRQTYRNKHLLIWDTGEMHHDYGDIDIIHALPKERGQSIGALRNAANASVLDVDILIHFDSDDWSAPRRIENQVAHLQESGADAVGYDEMLFWRNLDRGLTTDVWGEVLGGEAWLYSNQGGIYTLGTSLCYWRKTWEGKPFEDLRPLPGAGEDKRWLETRPRIICANVSAFTFGRFGPSIEHPGPMMVAEIHGSNSSSKIHDGPYQKEWKRMPELDMRLAEIMEL